MEIEEADKSQQMIQNYAMQAYDMCIQSIKKQFQKIEISEKVKSSQHLEILFCEISNLLDYLPSETFELSETL